MSKKCSVDGCTRSGRVVLGLCTMHYQRWKKHGSVHVVLPSPSGADHYGWKEDVGYSAAHNRVYVARGSASKHTCECGCLAEDWAYDHLDKNELTGKYQGYDATYSPDPKHYIAMCRLCHRSFDDRAKSKEEALSLGGRP